MQPLISESYKQLNARLHESRADYGAGGERYAPYIRSIATKHNGLTILDYGAGKGSLKRALWPLEVSEYDPAIPGKDQAPVSADIVACTDVLEHIEPECLDTVLDHIQSLTKKAAFLVIATVPAKKTLADGRNAHLIQESPKWWLDKLWSRFRIVMFQESDKAKSLVVLAVPK